MMTDMVDPPKQPFPSQAAPPPVGAEDPQEVERRYLARVREECRYLDSEGVDRRRAELSDVFVMLQAVESPHREIVADVAPVPERAEEMGIGEKPTAFSGRGRSQKIGQPPPSPVPLSQALRGHNHLVILGEPGAGKSTVLQYIALCLASQGWARERLDLDEDRIPVRVELRTYGGSTRLDDFILDHLYRAYVPEQEARDWLKNGRLALLLDGLDEVPETCRGQVVAQIAGFAGYPTYVKCRIVVTSRIAGYQEIGRAEPSFGKYTVCPLTGAETVLRYVVGWLAALGTAPGEMAQNQAQILLGRIQGQQGLRRVLSNPLLLRLAVVVYVETREPPANRAGLYQRYVRDVAWERAREREAPCWPREQIEAALEAIAWTLQTQGEKTRAELVGPVEVSMARVGQCTEPTTYLQQNLGLLASYGERHGQALIAFRHLTFREYFVARRLHREWIQDPQRAWRFLRPRLHHPAWREPILLLAGMLDEEQASKIVNLIWKKAHSPYERELHRDMLLAASILADGTEVRVRTENKLTRSVLGLCLDVDVRWMHSALLLLAVTAFIGLCAIKLLPVSVCLAPLPIYLWALVWCATELGWLPRLRALLALPQRWSGRGRHQHIRRQILGILSELPKHHGVAPLMQAVGSANWDIRSGAIEALGKIGVQVVAPLIQALDDADESVRREAAAALGKIGGAEVVAPLIRALDDADESVRREAAAALGKIGDAEAIAPLRIAD
jgi:hypothetical protein